MEVVALVRLPEPEKFIGSFGGRAVLYEPSRRCFVVRSLSERVELECFGSTVVDYADVLDRYLVVVCEDDDGCHVHVFDIQNCVVVLRQWLPFWVRCGSSSADALVLSGENGIALIETKGFSVRTVLSGSDYGRIALRVVLASDRWLIGGSGDFGDECRRVEDLNLVWTRGDHQNMFYVTELQWFDRTSHVAFCSDGTSRRVEIVDSASGNIRWSMDTCGSLVAVINGVVLLRSGECLAGYSVSGHRLEQSWKAGVPAEAMIPVSGGCWIQHGNALRLLNALGDVVARLEVDCNRVLVGAAEGVVFVGSKG